MGLHGIVVNQLATGERPIGVLSQSAIGLVGTSTAATGLAVAETKLVRGAADVLALGLSGAGTLLPALNAIFANGRAEVIVHRVAIGVDEPATTTNVAGSSATNTGVYALRNAKNLTGVKPKILIAPQYSSALTVASGLISVATQLQGFAWLDSENSTAAAAITLRNTFSDPLGHAAFVDPFCLVNAVAVPSSSFAAGLMAQVDQTEGFWVSPSNHPILGIEGTSRPVSFELGDATSEAATLNAEEIVTIVREQGFRLWGNRTLSAEPLYQFINARRTSNAIAESIKLNHLWAVDKGITRNFAGAVLGGVNDFLRRLRARGAIIGGSAWIDPELNTAGSLADGELWVDYDFTIVPPAESINFNQRITTRYLSEVFA